MSILLFNPPESNEKEKDRTSSSLGLKLSGDSLQSLVKRANKPPSSLTSISNLSELTVPEPGDSQTAITGLDEQLKEIKPKKKRKPLPKISFETIMAPHGLLELESLFSDVVLFEGDDEFTVLKNLNILINTVNLWATDNYPYFPFDDFLNKTAKLGTTAQMRYIMEQLSLGTKVTDLDGVTLREPEEEEEDVPIQPGSGAPDQVDYDAEFDFLRQLEEFELLPDTEQSHHSKTGFSETPSLTPRPMPFAQNTPKRRKGNSHASENFADLFDFSNIDID